MKFFVSRNGNDNWSGRIPEPDTGRIDGPFATIEKARDTIRTLKFSGKLSEDVTVYIREGRYHLEKPLVFTPDDSGPVVYSAYPGEHPVLDGGIQITNWKEITIDGRRAFAAEIAGIDRKNCRIKQLFVNGKRKRRTRLPETGFYRMEKSPEHNSDFNLFNGSSLFRYKKGEVKNWRNLCDIDILVPHWWIVERLPLVSVDETTQTAVSSRRSMFTLLDDKDRGPARYWIENVPDALRQPGQWYFDRQESALYYVPEDGETPETISAFVPILTQLLILKGHPGKEKYVEFLRFEGLTFEHAEWYQPAGGAFPSMPEKLVDYGSSPQASCNVPGVVYLEGARFCTIDGCRIQHVGWYGVELADGCTGNRITDCEIVDLGAGGVKLNGGDAGSMPAIRTAGNVVSNNHIADGGHVFQSAVGILSMHSAENEFSHNHIHDFYYSGISCGWVWGYAESVSKNNIIEKNHIHNIGKGLLSDMGGIYTLGVQPGTVIRGNLIHDIEAYAYGGWAIYADEGTSHVIIENNICFNTSSACFNQHYGRENIVRNNILAFGKEAIVSLGRAEKHLSFTLERNVLVSNGSPIYVFGYMASEKECLFLSDLNVLWDTSGEVVACILFNDKTKLSIAAMRKLGYDIHSEVADPAFVDIEKFNFTLKECSPAFRLGFRASGIANAGT